MWYLLIAARLRQFNTKSPLKKRAFSYQKDGYLLWEMAQNPETMGYEVMKTAVAALKETLPTQKNVDTGVTFYQCWVGILLIMVWMGNILRCTSIGLRREI